MTSTTISKDGLDTVSQNPAELRSKAGTSHLPPEPAKPAKAKGKSKG